MQTPRRIEKFVSYFPRVKTQRSYRSALYAFFDTVYPPGSDVKSYRRNYMVKPEERAKYEDLADRYFETERNYYDDIDNFLKVYKNHPSCTRASYSNPVKMFLRRNGPTVETRQGDNIVKKEVPVIPNLLGFEDYKQIQKRYIKVVEAETEETPLSREDLQKIILNTTNPMEKALFSFMASCGTRIEETVRLELEDIDMDNKKINIHGAITKTGRKRIAFFSEEAKEFLLQWLKLRPFYKKRGGRGRFDPLTDNRLFPISSGTARYAWVKALKRLGLDQDIDKNTRRRKRRVHQTRKFFRSNLGLKISPDIPEALMGHGEAQTRVYKQYPEEKIQELYESGEEVLNIFKPRTDIEKVNREVAAYKQQINQQSELINLMGVEQRNQKAEIKNLEEKLNQILTLLPKARALKAKLDKSKNNRS